MSAAYVSIHVGEDVPLNESVTVAKAGDPCAWVYVDGFEAAVWGSPAAMRRFAAAVVIAAENADVMRGAIELGPAARGRRAV